ncbi:hypothetical protein DO021_16475 [Desulfobacter hydrogenophilus]|uniref:PAS domain-containing protein n=1 Tax=Desulfobacter hydrogenophilus TaxID=2291 RepID=A0A328FD46_9BACT|nr:hypothetical protein [Desulfobacter hydrogenophilus]NDY73015.1 hypothetical protein [Desulfobacter hydrogenophilus]QBH15212.1 hypothetical protein EYB58_21205 [Desulfobacter hydrogenophilus]RAM00957.1 hypothetical protein DO021_16475 [Desulfobacter hydrogenophilus]
MRIDPIFQRQVFYMDLESIKNSEDLICIVDSEMKLKAYNNAWENFAINNGGDKITQTYSLGSNITEVGEEPIKSFIKKNIAKRLF